MTALLSVQNLSVEYWGLNGHVRAVNDVSFDIERGEIFGLAGESGSGKSTIGKALMRILQPPGVITGGAVFYDGADILTLDSTRLRRLRWQHISMVFQSALNALNPVMPIGRQLIDTLEAHGQAADAAKRARELLALVDIDPERLHDYPHQLSGGMRQRVGIALALALNPDLLIMDEPTTALDVVVQKDILHRIYELQQARGFSILFITHDLPLMLTFCDRVGVLYSGRLCETAPSAVMRHSAQHPYSRGLMSSFPDLRGDQVEMRGIDGSPPSLMAPPPGCRFHPRCEHAMDRCRQDEPKLVAVGARHRAACHLIEPPHHSAGGQP